MRAAITGAASGIGRAVCDRFVADASHEGKPARLLLVDASKSRLEAAVSEVRAAGAEAIELALDLASPTAGETFAAAVEDHFADGLDALVSNAGIIRSSTLEEISLAEYEETFAINTRATLLVARAALPQLRAAPGAIVATSSISSKFTTPRRGVYAASKAALALIVSQMAYEWGQYGIRCNCVAPGPVSTTMTEASYGNPEIRAERAERIPVGHVAEPEELASVISFLVSDDARYLNGENITVDGGFQTAVLQGALTLRADA